jgi:hypothetical protein
LARVDRLALALLAQRVSRPLAPRERLLIQKQGSDMYISTTPPSTHLAISPVYICIVHSSFFRPSYQHCVILHPELLTEKFPSLLLPLPHTSPIPCPDMPQDDLVEIILQIAFGLTGLVLAIAALHYRDSIVSMLLRRYRGRTATCRHSRAAMKCSVS